MAGDARLAGAVVDVNAPIGGSLRTGGANVTIGPLTEIGGRLDAGGANVSMIGHVHGAARLAGASIVFNGQTDGPLTLAGEHIVVGSLAHIGGDLTIYSRQDAEIDPAAVITGATQRYEPPAEWRNIPSWAFGFCLAGAMVLGTILAGIVLMLFGGRLFITALDHARLRPVSTILIGVVTLILVPAVAIILSATVVGLPIGLALLLALPLLFVFGHPIAAAGIAAGIFVRNSGPVGIARGAPLRHPRRHHHRAHQPHSVGGTAGCRRRGGAGRRRIGAHRRRPAAHAGATAAATRAAASRAAAASRRAATTSSATAASTGAASRRRSQQPPEQPAS